MSLNESSATTSLQYRTERSLLRLRDKFHVLTADCWTDEIVDRVGDGLAYRETAFAALAILEDLMEDLGIEIPTYEEKDEEAARAPSNENSPRNDKSGEEGISVTSSNRGRPATGNAMTNAERQAKFRAKQADLLTEEATGAA